MIRQHELYQLLNFYAYKCIYKNPVLYTCLSETVLAQLFAELIPVINPEYQAQVHILFHVEHISSSDSVLLVNISKRCNDKIGEYNNTNFNR